MINNILDDPVFFVLSLFILGELILAFVLFNNTKNFIANSRTVRATVVKIALVGSATKAYVTFKDPLGRTVDGNVTVSPNECEVGQEIEVLSHKENPGKLMLRSSVNIYLKILPRALLASAIVMMGLLGILVSSDTIKLPF